MEHTICDYRGRRFSEHGDSGSLVFNMDGLVVGLLFGGAQSLHRSYFTHIDELYEDIRAVTGMEVRLMPPS